MSIRAKSVYFMLLSLFLSTSAVIHAAQTADSMDVRAEVVPTCVVSSTVNVDFGVIVANQQTEHDALGSLTWRCTQFAFFITIGLDGGTTTGNVNNRTMLHADGSQLPYQLYRNAARDQVWGNTFFQSRFAFPFLNFATPVNYSIYGRILDSDVVGKSTGAYTDTVTVTLNF